MRIFSRISASACELLWIRLTYLFLSFFTTSYSAENSFNLAGYVRSGQVRLMRGSRVAEEVHLLDSSLHLLVRSCMTISLMRTCCLASRSLLSMRVVSLKCDTDHFHYYYHFHYTMTVVPCHAIQHNTI